MSAPVITAQLGTPATGAAEVQAALHAGAEVLAAVGTCAADLYKQAASALNVPIPKDVMRTTKMIDGVTWDGKDPRKYADGFKIKA